MGSTNFNGRVTARGGITPGAASLVTLTASATLTALANAGKTMILSAAAGLTVTLPAATATGHIFRFFVATTITSNDYIIQVASADDTMAGVQVVANDGGATASVFETVAASDTITLDGSTTGGILGQTIEIQDVAAGVFAVNIQGAATGTEATAFSAAVS